MPSYQKVQVMGHLGRDPEVRYSQAGEPVANFSVAVTEKRSGSESTEWFNCVAFKKTAEIVQKYLHKGDAVFAEGKLQTRKYQGRDGTEKKSVEVIVNNLVLMGAKRQTQEAETGEPIGDNDIPF